MFRSLSPLHSKTLNVDHNRKRAVIEWAVFRDTVFTGWAFPFLRCLDNLLSDEEVKFLHDKTPCFIALQAQNLLWNSGVNQGRIQLSLLWGGGAIRLGKNLTDCLKDILLASQDWVKDGKRFRLWSLKPLLFLFIYYFIYFISFFFFAYDPYQVHFEVYFQFSRIYQLFHLLLKIFHLIICQGQFSSYPSKRCYRASPKSHSTVEVPHHFITKSCECDL